MVWQDLLGLNNGHTPKFVKKYANLHQTISEAVTAWANDVGAEEFPDVEHSYM